MSVSPEFFRVCLDEIAIVSVVVLVELPVARRHREIDICETVQNTNRVLILVIWNRRQIVVDRKLDEAGDEKGQRGRQLVEGMKNFSWKNKTAQKKNFFCPAFLRIWAI